MITLAIWGLLWCNKIISYFCENCFWCSASNLWIPLLRNSLVILPVNKLVKAFPSSRCFHNSQISDSLNLIFLVTPSLGWACLGFKLPVLGFPYLFPDSGSFQSLFLKLCALYYCISHISIMQMLALVLLSQKLCQLSYSFLLLDGYFQR